MVSRLDMAASAAYGSDTEPISLDPAVVAGLKARKRRRYLTRQVPALRLAGFAILLAIVAISTAATGNTSWAHIARLTLVATVYCAATSAALWFAPDHWLDALNILFMATDPLIWMGAIYATGGADSWLYFLPLVRVADQLNTSRAHVIGYTLVGVSAYAALLAYITVIDGTPIVWTAQIGRLLFLGGCGGYLALTAGTAEKLRAALGDAVRTSRESIRLLQEQSALLRDSQERAHEASVAKSQFIANMSHEFRTPLNAIVGYTELLQDEWPGVTPQIREDLDRVHSAARHLTSLVNDVIDFSRGESGRLALNIEPFSIDALISEVVAVAMPGVRDHGNTLDVSGAADAGSMTADAAKVRQILLNLVGNASKFTQNGAIRLEVRRERTTGGIEIVFVVRDTGVGMTPEQLAAIRRFEPFVQGEGSVTRRYGGMGLGLSISHRLCRAMGGTLSIDSQARAGTTVVVRLPVSVRPGAAAHP